MRTISKGAEPCCLKAWKRKNPHGAYDDLDKTEEGKVVRAKIRDYALNEQFYLCAYCCQRIEGRVEGLSDRAAVTIRVLNLGDHEKNNRALIETRKQLSNVLLWENGINPDDGLEDDEILNILIDDLSQPQQDQMEPFTPVVINILRSWLQA